MATAFARNQQENLLLRAAPLKKFCLENKESPASLQCSPEARGFPSREFVSICGELR
jgi:hypothetical protein